MNTKDRKNHKASENPISIQAKNWVMRIKSGPVAPEVQARFRGWLSENPANKTEFDLISAIWDHSDVLKDHPLALDVIKESLAKEGVIKKRKWLEKIAAGPSIIRPVAIAAMALLIVAGAWFIQINLVPQKTYRTATGEQRVILLADGSMVHLDAETVISVYISRKSRQIELLKTGQAFFSVVHDTNRPFVVTSGQIVVRALGTEFNVNKKINGRVSVAVLSGRIQVNRKSEGKGSGSKKVSELQEKKPGLKQTIISNKTDKPHLLANEIIESGQAVIFDERERTCEIKPIDIKGVDTWRKGRLYFKMAPLDDVIDEINRYLENKIILGDNRVKDIRVSINFNIIDREHFVNTLLKAAPVSAQTNSQGQVLLFKKEEK